MILEGVPVYGEEANPTQQIEENVQDEVQDNKQKDNIALQSDVATTASGQCGENAYWELTSDGVFTIYGTGPMTRYGYDWDDYTPKHDWNVYLKTIKKVVVEDGITTISPYSFYGSTSLKEVVIPKSVTQIGEDAFQWCKNVEKVSIDGLESWCRIEFENNNSNPLQFGADLYIGGTKAIQLNIPEGITEIKNYTFARNVNENTVLSITGVHLPDTIVKIGKSAFGGNHMKSF